MGASPDTPEIASLRLVRAHPCARTVRRGPHRRPAAHVTRCTSPGSAAVRSSRGRPGTVCAQGCAQSSRRDPISGVSRDDPSTSAPQCRRDGKEGPPSLTKVRGEPFEEKKKESADKPGSVESSHSSALRVAAQLKRPTRELVWAHLTLPYSVLLRVGFALPQSVTTCAVRSYRTISPLPAIAGGRYFLCCTFRRLAPPRRYLAPCPMEPGLSSRCYPSGCLADSRREVYALWALRCAAADTDRCAPDP